MDMSDRLNGRAMNDRARASGVRLALSPQEMIGIVGLLLLGLGMLLPWGGLTSEPILERLTAYGGTQLWGGVALMLAIPQIVGLSIARLGYAEMPLSHNVRVTLLAVSASVLTFISLIFALAGSVWIGGGVPLLLAISAAQASRHVHLNNGTSRRSPYLDEKLSKVLTTAGYLPGHTD